MSENPNTQEFRPIQQPRRGETTAWALGLVSALVGVFAPDSMGYLGSFAWVLAGIFGLSALVISFGKWIDRRTILKYDAQNIMFENGLRNISFAWEDIQSVHVQTGKFGKKVFVVGKDARFSFQTLGQVQMGADWQGLVGFEHGEKILHTLLDRSGLINKVVASDDTFTVYQR